MRIRPRTRLQLHAGNDLNRWTISLADFMTLMFAVFVVLYAASVSHEKKYEDVMLSIQNASRLLNKSVFSSSYEGILTKTSNSLIENSGPALLSQELVKQADDQLSESGRLQVGEDLGHLKIQLETQFSSELGENLINLDLNGDWLTIEMGGDLLFVGGSHSLLKVAKREIGKLAKILKPVNNMLRIRGYTDTDTISNEIYFSNWELAGARAFTVLHALNEQGITGKRMVMEAYGKHSPVIDNDGNVDKLKSRRVVIAISKYALVEIKKKKSIVKSIKNESSKLQLAKPDSKEMYELHLPKNRLIITTRQE